MLDIAVVLHVVMHPMEQLVLRIQDSPIIILVVAIVSVDLFQTRRITILLQLIQTFLIGIKVS